MSKLGDVKVKTAEALRASEADDGASVVLVAVVREFDSKADKANRMADGDGSARDAIIELEQAGDSAKAAAEADPDLGEAAHAPARVTRGGSFLCSETYCMSYRTSARRGTDPMNAMSHLGFRLAMDESEWKRERDRPGAK